MAVPPVDEWGFIDHLTSWVTWAVGAIAALVTSTITATYFITTLKSEVDELRRQMEEGSKERAQLRDELHTEVRSVVHDLRNEFTKAHSDNQLIMRRIDEHLLRVENRSDQRFDQLIKLLVGRPRED